MTSTIGSELLRILGCALFALGAGVCVVTAKDGRPIHWLMATALFYLASVAWRCA